MFIQPGTDFSSDHPRPLVTDMLKRRSNVNFFYTYRRNKTMDSEMNKQTTTNFKTHKNFTLI